MTPFIPNGTYKVRNGLYTNLVADLVDPTPGGAIAALTDSSFNVGDKWKVLNHGSGGNQITLENVSTPGIYAVENLFGTDQLVGSYHGPEAPTVWTVVKVDGGRYYLQTPEANRVWQLPEGAPNVNILVVPHTGQDNTTWLFDQVQG